MDLGPPALRSPRGYQLGSPTDSAALVLQRCAACDAVQYPPRELCHHCLGAELAWTPVPGGGELLARSELHHSLEPWFLDQLPWTLASVRLDCGPVVLAWLRGGCPAAASRVEVSHYSQPGGSSILQASAILTETS